MKLLLIVRMSVLCLALALVPLHAEETAAGDLVDRLIRNSSELLASTNSVVDPWLTALVGAGRVDAALAAAHGRRHADSRCWGLAAISRALAQLGDLEPAADVALEALAVGRQQVEYGGRRTRAIARAAAALHHVGREAERDAALLEVEAGLNRVDNAFIRDRLVTTLYDSIGGSTHHQDPLASGVPCAS